MSGFGVHPVICDEHRCLRRFAFCFLIAFKLLDIDGGAWAWRGSEAGDEGQQKHPMDLCEDGGDHPTYGKFELFFWFDGLLTIDS